MAYKSCAANIAASIVQDCNKPLVGGYTGRAVIIPTSDWARAEVVVDADNPRKIMSIILPPDGSAMAYTIDNVFATPFTGSTTAGNNESGRNGYLKTIAVRIPMRGADVSRDVIEPLVKDADGFIVIAEKRDKVGDGSYEVIGYQNSMRGDIASVTRDESANGGDWLMNLTTIEKWAEVTLVGAGDDYETARKNFEELLNFEPQETRLVFDDEINQAYLSANGLVYIDSIRGGEKVRETYSALNNTSVSIDTDAGTEVVIYGALTYLGCDYAMLTSLDLSKNTALTKLDCSYTGLTSLDLSKNTALNHLECIECTGLTSLDLSKNTALTKLDCSYTMLTSLDLFKNTALTYLDCSECQNLLMLNIKNTAELASGTIVDQSMANLTTLQVAGTSAWAYEQVESWLSDFAPDNGVIYVDENTPQGVITEAEGKSWEVIYIS